MQISITVVDSNSIHIMQEEDLKAEEEGSMFLPLHIMWIIVDVGNQSPACNYH